MFGDATSHHLWKKKKQKEKKKRKYLYARDMIYLLFLKDVY